MMLATMIAASCGSSSDPQSPEELGALLSGDPAATVIQTHFSGITEPTSRLITSADEWARVWAQIHANVEPKPARPAIDFQREALVLVALGTATSSLEIEDVRRFERGVVAQVLVETYSERCLVLLAIGQPVHVVRIARPPARTLLVNRTHQVRECL
jgi:hypothetical protein